MQLTLLHGYPDLIGKRSAWCGYGNGPKSYVPLTGDPLVVPQFQYYIDNVNGSVMSVSGNYQIIAKPSGVGPRQTWAAIWRYSGAQGEGVNSVAIATAGSGQTNGTYTITDSGTNFATRAAKVSITIAGGAVTKATVVDPGAGYFGAPTFTVAEGGTPGTLSATTGLIAGTEVASGADLSAEQVQLAGFGGTY